MSDERMIRVDNLKLLMKTASMNKADVARLMIVSDAYVRKLLSGRPGTFGEKAARKVEEAFKKTRFWLDVPHAGGEYTDPSDQLSGHPTTVGEGLPSYLVHSGGESVTSFPMAPVLEWSKLGEDLYRANNECPASELRAVPTTKAVSPRIKWIPVVDDSLAPKILPGDLVAIDPDSPAVRDQVALFKTGDGAFLLRRYRPLANGGFEATDGVGDKLDSERYGLTVVGAFCGLFRDHA
jgi:hypothetical protein